MDIEDVNEILGPFNQFRKAIVFKSYQALVSHKGLFKSQIVGPHT